MDNGYLGYWCFSHIAFKGAKFKLYGEVYSSSFSHCISWFSLFFQWVPPWLLVSLSLVHNPQSVLECLLQIAPSVAHCTELQSWVIYWSRFPHLLCCASCLFVVSLALILFQWQAVLWSRKLYQVLGFAFSLCLSNHTWNYQKIWDFPVFSRDWEPIAFCCLGTYLHCVCFLSRSEKALNQINAPFLMLQVWTLSPGTHSGGTCDAAITASFILVSYLLIGVTCWREEAVFEWLELCLIFKRLLEVQCEWFTWKIPATFLRLTDV